MCRFLFWLPLDVTLSSLFHSHVLKNHCSQCLSPTKTMKHSCITMHKHLLHYVFLHMYDKIGDLHIIHNFTIPFAFIFSYDITVICKQQLIFFKFILNLLLHINLIFLCKLFFSNNLHSPIFIFPKNVHVSTMCITFAVRKLDTTYLKNTSSSVCSIVICQNHLWN